MPVSEAITRKVQDLFCADKYDEALAYLKELLTSDGNDSDTRSEIHKLLGRIHYYRQETAVAKGFFKTAIAENPDDPYALFHYGQCLEALGDPQGALRIFAECMERTKNKDGIADHISDLLRAFPIGDSTIKALFSERTPRKGIGDTSSPKVSIIVLCYNNVEYTIRCLSALFANTDYPNLEVIVVDNASIDDTPGYLEMYSRKIKFLHSTTNLGFVGGNNFAAQAATGDVLVFLNNDTEVQKEWLGEMLRCLATNPEAGAVGARLLYPDKKVQEAGGIIFSDGNGWNYGRGYPPHNSIVSFVREVDYCSGAALMVRADLFRLLGGFDARYAPAYCEDSDLCFGIRALGFKVLYCPSAVVIHHEGVTSGTDVTKGFKRFQAINVPKFREKWAKEIAQQLPNDRSSVHRASRRGGARSVLIIDDWPPLPDKASGTMRMYTTVKEMLRLGWHVTYAHLVGTRLGSTAESYLAELRGLGVELIWLEYERWWMMRNSPDVRPMLRQIVNGLGLKERLPDLVYLSFWFVGEYFLDLVREELPQTPIIMDTHDLHYLRETRQAEVHSDKAKLNEALKNKRRELAVYAKADCVTTVTEEDRRELLKELPGKPVFIMTNIHEIVPSEVPISERKDLLFVGNFNHTPNEDAVLYFAEAIFPRIRATLPDVKFVVAGNNPTARVRALESPSVVVTGWVPSLKVYFDGCRLSVVPIRYGAGVKGKVGEAIAHGLPCVMTSIAAEGMNIVDGTHALIADDPVAFADAVIRLYNDSSQWSQLVENGKELVRRQYSAAATRQRLKYIASFETREAFTSYRAARYPVPPLASIIIVTYNQWENTRQCLESIKRFTTASHEIIIVDNGSNDKTVERLRKYPEVRLIQNGDNRGFPAAVNQGLCAATGEHVILLNNDAVVTTGWLERMLDVAASDKSIGIVGPMCNAISGAQFDEEAKYSTLEAMHQYAREASERRKGQVQVVPRVAFFCTLITRDVIDALGGVDERFTPGNFEDDDYCLRANIAGFRTVVAKDVFVHHFGSKSFRADGDAQYKLRLEKNLGIFTEKWGAPPKELWTMHKPPLKRQIMIPLRDDDFVRWFDRARTAIEEGSLPAAFEAIVHAIDHYHDVDGMGTVARFDEVLALGGSIAIKVGRHEEAIAWYRRAVELAPESAKARNGLELALKRNGQGGKGHQALESALDVAQRFFAERNYSMALGSLTEIDAVITAIKDENQRNEYASAIENFRGVCNLALTRFDEAKLHFEKSLRINPSSSRACAGLGEIFFATGHPEASKTMFEWAVKNDPVSDAAREGLARANQALGLAGDHSTLAIEANEDMAVAGQR